MTAIKNEDSKASTTTDNRSELFLVSLSISLPLLLACAGWLFFAVTGQLNIANRYVVTIAKAMFSLTQGSIDYAEWITLFQGTAVYGIAVIVLALYFIDKRFPINDDKYSKIVYPLVISAALLAAMGMTWRQHFVHDLNPPPGVFGFIADTFYNLLGLGAVGIVAIIVAFKFDNSKVKSRLRTMDDDELMRIMEKKIDNNEDIAIKVLLERKKPEIYKKVLLALHKKDRVYELNRALDYIKNKLLARSVLEDALRANAELKKAIREREGLSSEEPVTPEQVSDGITYFIALDAEYFAHSDSCPTHIYNALKDGDGKAGFASTPEVGDYLSFPDFEPIDSGDVRNHDYSLKVTSVDEYYREKGQITLFVNVHVPLRVQFT